MTCQPCWIEMYYITYINFPWRFHGKCFKLVPLSNTHSFVWFVSCVVITQSVINRYFFSLWHHLFDCSAQVIIPWLLCVHSWNNNVFSLVNTVKTLVLLMSLHGYYGVYISAWKQKCKLRCTVCPVLFMLPSQFYQLAPNTHFFVVWKNINIDALKARSQ